MGQSGILEADRLMFADSLSSPEKIEVVMGRCFPLSGPGGGYNGMSIPVVKQIVYKNRDGATFTQTFSDVISSENDNYRTPVSTKQQQQEEGDNRGCRNKSVPFVKHEASDGTRSEVVIKSTPRRNTLEAVNREWQTKMKQSNHVDHHHSRQTATLPIDSEEIKRISAANSPRFRVKNKVESPKATPPELTGREAWDETQKKKAQLREEFFRVPYEECNREAMRGMGGRLNKSEPKLNTVAKERKKRNSLSYKRRVHFNMDDSQLEEIRKWREERRMQATSPCIKTVARIYSLDAPSSSQRQIEYVNSFDSPKAEVPVAISLQDNPPSRTKTARPTDLDSLQRLYSSTENPANTRSDNNPKLRGDSTTESRERTENMSAHLQGRLMVPNTESSNPSKAQKSIDKETSPKTQNRLTSQPLSDYCRTNTSSNYHQQSQTQPSSPTKLIDLSQQSRVQKHSSPSTQTQHLHPSSTNVDVPHSVQQQNKIQQNQQQQAAKQQHSAAQSLENNVLNTSVRPKDFHPHVMHPVPMPRSKSLTAKRDIPSKESPSESQYTADTSVRAKTYASRRATSLDRAYVKKQPSALLFDFNHELKSPGLILNHMRSPTHTSSNHQPLSNTIIKKKQSYPSPQNITQTSQKSSNSIQNPQPTMPRPAPTQFESNTPLSNSNNEKNSVSIIRSYTYPKRNSVTTLQKLPDQSNDAISTPTKPNDVSQDYHKSETQHPKILNNSRHITDNHPSNTSSQISNTAPTLKKFPNQSNENALFIPNGLYQDVNKNKKQHPNFLNNNNTRHIPDNYSGNASSQINNSAPTIQKLSNQSSENTVFITPAVHNRFGHQDYHTNPPQHQNLLNHNRNNPDNCPGNDASSQFSNNSYQQSFRTPSTNSNRRAPHKLSNKENENVKDRSQKTSPHGKGNSVKILMTKGESFSKHRIVLNSHVTSMTPRVTVRKIIVPASTSSSSSSAPVMRSAPSPTPSFASSSCSFGSSGSSSSGCFSGSPSPTPTPSPTRVRASGVPTDL